MDHNQDREMGPGFGTKYRILGLARKVKGCVADSFGGREYSWPNEVVHVQDMK